MKFLVGDIGNTLTKLSLLNQRYKIVKSYSIETSKLKLKKERNKFLKKFLVKNLN